MHASQFAAQGKTLAAALILALGGVPRAAQGAFEAPEEESGPEEGPEAAEDEDEDPKIKRAMEAFERGEKHYAASEFEAALEAFLDAQSLFPSPDFHYDIGQCYEKLDKFEEAIRAYRSYLRGKPEATDYATVKTRIGELETLHEEQKRAAEEAGAQEEPKDPSKALVISGAVLMGVGAAAALGGSIGFGLQARTRSSEVDDINAGNNPDRLTVADVEALDAAGRRAETFQIVSVGVGGAVAIVGAVLLAIGLKKKKQAASAAAALPRLHPMLGSKSMGFALSGRF